MNPPTSSGRSSGGVPFWEPPSPEELSAALPAYEVTALLGRGGMGAVYRAVQRSLKREVAIKVLAPAADDELKFAERFRHEAETLARLNHPGIVHIHDFGETADGLLYLVMEFVDGTDVHQLIQGSGRLSEEYALAITAHVCDALTYAHSRGVVHRDIKPANVLIDQDGNVKVADFGLAKMVDPQFDSGLTMSNVALGTPDFVAPEVLSYGMEVDHRADLYAVGVMLYQMLTGELPRGLFKLPSQKYQEIDPRLDGVICRALEPDREERYQSAVEVRAELFEISTPRLAKMEEASLVVATPMPRDRRTQRIAVMAGVAILLMAGIWGGTIWLRPGSASVPAPPAETDLLKDVDLKSDVIAGTWFWDSGGLKTVGTGSVPGGGYPRVEFAQVPPPEYDFEVEFTSDTDENDAGLVFSIGGKQTAVIMNIHTWTGYVAGLAGVGGAPMHVRLGNNGRPTPYFRKGQRDVALVEVRKDRVTTKINGEVIEEWPVTSGFVSGLDPGSAFTLDDPAKLGIMAGPSTPITFHRVVVREVTDSDLVGVGNGTTKTASLANNRPDTEKIDWLKSARWDTRWSLENGRVQAARIGATRYFGVAGDGSVRVRFREAPADASNSPPLQLSFRGGPNGNSDGQESSYLFQIHPARKLIQLLLMTKNTRTKVGVPEFLWKDLPLPPAVPENGEVELEMRAIGEELSLWSGSTKVTSIRDTRSQSGAWVLSVDPGVEITALETSGIKPNAGTISPPQTGNGPPLITNWQDMTATLRENAGKIPGVVVEEGSVHLADGISPQNVMLTPPGLNHFAMRVRYTGETQVNRMITGQGFDFVICQKSQIGFKRVTNGNVSEDLAPWQPHPAGYNSRVPHDLLVTMNGTQIRAWVDGFFMGEAKDEKITEGEAGLMLLRDAIIHQVEIAEITGAGKLDAGVAATSPHSLENWTDRLGTMTWKTPWSLKDGALSTSAPTTMQELGQVGDGALRIRARVAAGTDKGQFRGPTLQPALRIGPVKGATNRQGSYQFQAYLPGGACSLVYLERDLKTGTDLPPEYLWKDSALPPDLRGKEEIEWEFRAVGDELSAWADGQFVASARDARVAAGRSKLTAFPGIEITSVETSGIKANTPAAANQNDPPNITNWQDVTESLRETARTLPGLIVGGETVAHTGEGGPIAVPVSREGLRDRAIRLTHSGDGQVSLRHASKGILYVLCQRGQTIFQRHDKDAAMPVKLIPDLPHPSTHQHSASHELLMTSQGPLVRAWLDGRFLGEVRDEILADGVPEIVVSKWGEVTKVEIAELSDNVAREAWQPLFTQPEDFVTDAANVEIRDGWLSANTAKTHYAPTDSIDGAIRATVRFHPKDTANLTARANDGAPWGKEAYACSVFITPDGKTATLMSTMEKVDGEKPWKRHDFPLPVGLREGEEFALELRVEGDQIAVLFNGKDLGSVTHPFPATNRHFGIMTSMTGVSEFRDVAWQKLE